MLNHRPTLMFISAIALLCAVVATASAGSDALSRAITKSQVKKVAAKQVRSLAPDLADERIDQRAPTLSVAQAGTAANAEQLDGRDSSDFAGATSEAVHRVGTPGEPAFQNSWQNVGDPGIVSPAGFYKDPFGIVHIEGAIFRDPDNSVAFTLPPGYRPGVELILPLAATAPIEAAALVIQADGDLIPDCNGTGCSNAGMDGLSFRVP